MVRKATPKETALQKVKTFLESVVPEKDILKGRTIIPIHDHFLTVTLGIGKALTVLKQLSPIVYQRNDLYRLNNRLAKHLENFQLPQAVLALVVLDGKLFLVDGNTRKRRWLNQPDAPVPSHVTFVLMGVSSLEEAVAIYGCYDSAQAKKTNRDEVMSLVRDTGVDLDMLKSKLVAGGKLVSVIRCMARALSGASASPARKKAVVDSHVKSILQLDRHMLDEGMIPGGAVWAVLRLYRELPEIFHKYVDMYVDNLRMLGTPTEGLASPAVIDTRDYAIRCCRLAGVGTSGEKPIPVMFCAYMEGFQDFAIELIRTKRAEAAFSRFRNKLCNKIIAPDVSRVRNLLAKPKV